MDEDVKSICKLKEGTLIKIILEQGAKVSQPYPHAQFEVKSRASEHTNLKEITGYFTKYFSESEIIIINPFSSEVSWRKERYYITDGVRVPIVLIKKYEKLHVKCDK